MSRFDSLCRTQYLHTRVLLVDDFKNSRSAKKFSWNALTNFVILREARALPEDFWECTTNLILRTEARSGLKSYLHYDLYELDRS
jgi:hypothetical protein